MMDTAVTTSNLWPSLGEIGSTDFLAPVTIMRQQAEAISLMTKNILEGQVISEKIVLRSKSLTSNNLTPTATAFLRLSQKGVDAENVSPRRADEEQISHTFFLRASALDGVKVRLFSVTHNVTSVYPAVVRSTFMKEGARRITIENEVDFRESLHTFFHSDAVIKILQSLIAQSIGSGDSIAEI